MHDGDRLGGTPVIVRKISLFEAETKCWKPIINSSNMKSSYFFLYLDAQTVLQQYSLSYKLVLRFLAGLMRFNKVGTAAAQAESGELPDPSLLTPWPYSVNIKQPPTLLSPPLYPLIRVQPFSHFP